MEPRRPNRLRSPRPRRPQPSLREPPDHRAGDAGEQRYLCFGDGAAAGRPLAAEGEVVKSERLQIVAEYSPQGDSRFKDEVEL